MYKILLLLCALVGMSMSFLAFPDGAVSVLLVLSLSFPTVLLIRKYVDDSAFLVNVFLFALIARLTFGLIIHLMELRQLFGPDAIGYDMIGNRLVDIWQGLPVPDDAVTRRVMTDNFMVGWGMNYLVGVIYFVFGRGILIAQSFCVFIGAATVPVVYFCSGSIFTNKRVSRISALAIALFPSFIIWSSQLLKDGLIIFLLVIAMTVVLELQKKFSYLAVVLLVTSLFGIISLRFYIFYMAAAAVAGTFIIGLSSSFESVVRRGAVILVVGAAMVYLGVIQNATSNFEQYGNLERIERSRRDLSESANSGFGEDIDVSTPAGALAAIPIGFSYLMFAPFPWQMDNYKALLLLPEMLIWWASFPILLMGLGYAVKNRFRASVPIFTFTFILTLAYSIFQGNVGMAYRQRTQIQVFLFMFTAVGWTLLQEKKENRATHRRIQDRQIREMVEARRLAS